MISTTTKYILSAAVLIASVIAGGSVYATSSSTTSGCLDPTKLSSYRSVSLKRGEGAITTKDGKPLCSDGQLLLQSFDVPASWGGKDVWDKTAIPQTEFARTAVTFPADKSSYTVTAKVAVPDACKGMQIDWNLAPGVTRIDTLDGDAAVNIAGKLIAGQGTCDTPPVTPPVTPPEPPVTPPVTPPVPPVPPTTPIKELPKTGTTIDVLLNMLGLGAITAAATTYVISRRSA